MSTLRVGRPSGFLLGYEPRDTAESGKPPLGEASPRHHNPSEGVLRQAESHLVESAVESLAVHVLVSLLSYVLYRHYTG